MMEGNLWSQSFFPPGKVSDYTGFQYLRDNDPDNQGHNTDFLTRIANNIIYILDDSQMSQLIALAAAQQNEINSYAYQRYPLMQAFRRQLTGDIPAGSTGLNMDAVKQASHDLYLIDGQMAYERAMLYSSIYSSLSDAQWAYINDNMKGKGYDSWPNITSDQIQSKMQGLSEGEATAVMTYAGDIFSWYVGSQDADVYFCPERHGTYYGGFYLKDYPGMGQSNWNMNEQLTNTDGQALSNSSAGYVTSAQAAVIDNLVNLQRNNLYAGSTSIVSTRTQISTLLRSLITNPGAGSSVNAQVLALSGTYGDLDGEDNYYYATAFAQVYGTLTSGEQSKLWQLWAANLTGTYPNGTPYNYTVCTTPFLYSDVITDPSVLDPYIDNTDYLFFEPQTGSAIHRRH
jgi:hypothetical protein